MNIVEAIRTNIEDIASTACEQGDSDDFLDPLRNIVEQLPDAITSSITLDISQLEKCGADNTQITKFLRTIKTEVIEILRKARDTQDSKEAPSFKDSVLALRACIRKVSPKAEIEPMDKDFYDSLLEGKSPDPDTYDRFFSFFRKTMDAVRDMLFVFDMNGNIMYANDYGMALTKYDTSDISNGLSIYDLVVPEHIDLIEARLESPKAAMFSPYSIEIYTKEGDRIPVEITSQSMTYQGNVNAIMCVARDFRLEHRLGKEVRRSNIRLETIFSAAPVGIIITNAEGIVTDANPVALRIMEIPDPTSIVGKSIFDIPMNGENIFREEFEKVLGSEKTVRMQYTSTTPSHKKIEYEVAACALGGSSGIVEGVSFFISEPKINWSEEQNYIQTERLIALGEVIAGVAHELNNPLTGVLGYTQLLLGTDLEPSVKAKLNNITAETDRCKNIVEGLLRFSRQSEPATQVHDVNDLLKDVLSLRDYQLRVDNIKVNTYFENDPLLATVDAQKLQRVFLNIITNAHQALLQVDDRDRELTVKTENQDDMICIKISDNGPGISREIQSRVYDPFFTTKTLGDGTGLGLSVAFGVIQSYCGHINLETELGVGTTFTILLPKNTD